MVVHPELSSDGRPFACSSPVLEQCRDACLNTSRPASLTRLPERRQDVVPHVVALGLLDSYSQETPIKSQRSTSLNRAVSQISFPSDPDHKGLVALGLLESSALRVASVPTHPANQLQSLKLLSSHQRDLVWTNLYPQHLAVLNDPSKKSTRFSTYFIANDFCWEKRRCDAAQCRSRACAVLISH